MRARTRRSQSALTFGKMREFLITVLMHLSFYAFIIFVVMFFIETFS